jgi:hypothetical protein
MKIKHCEIDQWFIDELPCYKRAKHTMAASAIDAHGPERIKLRICDEHLRFMRSVTYYNNDYGIVSTSRNVQMFTANTKRFGVVNAMIKFRENRL